ncbi:hypothetical protein AB6A40_010744 [Gnathostoma spinigerum]|uniref:Uncharacterized protein n=1 Tax=Gnathostoma spinigerum TaxID=75299 RepID=A0ABD6EVQ7_9BILA
MSDMTGQPAQLVPPGDLKEYIPRSDMLSVFRSLHMGSLHLRFAHRSPSMPSILTPSSTAVFGASPFHAAILYPPFKSHKVLRSHAIRSPLHFVFFR